MSNIDVVNTKHGLFAINKNDQYVGRSLKLLGEYCESELLMMKGFTDQDSVVIDVGANIGALSVPLSRHVKQVFSLEPIPYLYNLLISNLTLNEINNVKPLNVAAGAKDGRCSFPDVDWSKSGNFGCHPTKSYTGKNECPLVKVEVDCDLLKIDVEGHELNVLYGAETMINRCQPVLFIENDREEHGDKLIDYIQDELKYDTYWHSFPLHNPENFNAYKDNPFMKHGLVECCVNMLCLPKDTEFNLLPRAEKGSFKDRFNLKVQ